MAEATIIAVDLTTETPLEFYEIGSPPLDDRFFSQNIFNGDGAAGENVVNLEDLDFDFSFDDLGLPPSHDLDYLSHSHFGVDSSFAQFGPGYDQLHAVFKSSSPELHHISGNDKVPGSQSCDGTGLLDSSSPDTEHQQISGYLNMQSPESNGSNRGSTENCDGDGKGLNCRSPESQDTGNFESNVSEDSSNCVARSSSSFANCVVDQNVKLEEPGSVSLLLSVVLPYSHFFNQDME